MTYMAFWVESKSDELGTYLVKDCKNFKSSPERLSFCKTLKKTNPNLVHLSVLNFKNNCAPSGDERVLFYNPRLDF